MSKDRVWRGLGVIPPKYCMCTGYKRGSAPLSLLVFTNQRHRTLVRRPFLPPSLLSSPTCHNARRSLCSGGFIGSVFLRQQQQQIGKLPVSFLPSLFLSLSFSQPFSFPVVFSHFRRPPRLYSDILHHFSSCCEGHHRRFSFKRTARPAVFNTVAAGCSSSLR